MSTDDDRAMEQPSLFDLGPPSPPRRPRIMRPPQRRPRLNPLFFVVRPPSDIAGQIVQRRQDLCRRLGLHGKLVRADLLHITLCLVGGYSGDEAPTNVVKLACEVAASAVMGPFNVTCDRVTNFMPIVLLPSEGRRTLMELQRILAAALASSELAIKPASRFEPHMSILYKAGPIDEQPIDPISWTVKEFELVYSLIGQSRHILQKRWPLHG